MILQLDLVLQYAYIELVKEWVEKSGVCTHLAYIANFGQNQNVSTYREFLPYGNFIIANFVTAVLQNYIWNLAHVILWAIYFVNVL